MRRKARLSSGVALGILAALFLAAGGACGGGADRGSRAEGPPAAEGLVLGAGECAAAGGHRVAAGVLGGGATARSAGHEVKGGIRP